MPGTIKPHEIITGDAKPVRLPFRRVPLHLRAEVEKEIDIMLRRGVIEPSRSEWASPVVLVKKSDGSNRVCVDYRQINKILKLQGGKIPLIADLLDQIGEGKQFFTTLDLQSGSYRSC